MNNIIPSTLIYNKEVFVREPMDDYSKQIENIKDSKIILTGDRGTGKSSLLYHLENRNAGTEIPFIYTRFNAPNFSIAEEENGIYNEDFWKHYYEIHFANEILHYIKTYYELTYHKDFEKLQQYVSTLINQTNDFINNFMDEDRLLVNQVSQGEITGDILDQFIRTIQCESFNLGIDRFDWTNNSDELTQKILSQYFEFFNQVIITCDDEEFIKKLIGEIYPYYKDFCCMDSTKMHSFLSIKFILLKRLELLKKKEMNSKISTEWLTDDFIQMMRVKTNQDITTMSKVITQLFTVSFLYKITEHKCEECLNQELKIIRELRKNNSHPPKFHL